MATKTVTFWECDRCGKREDKRPFRPYDGGEVSLVYMVAGATCAHDTLTWKELCRDCSSYVEDKIELLKVKNETI